MGYLCHGKDKDEDMAQNISGQQSPNLKEIPRSATLLRPPSNHNSVRSSASSRCVPTAALVTKPRDALGPGLLHLPFPNLSSFASHNTSP